MIQWVFYKSARSKKDENNMDTGKNVDGEVLIVCVGSMNMTWVQTLGPQRCSNLKLIINQWPECDRVNRGIPSCRFSR